MSHILRPSFKNSIKLRAISLSLILIALALISSDSQDRLPNLTGSVSADSKARMSISDTGEELGVSNEIIINRGTALAQTFDNGRTWQDLDAQFNGSKIYHLAAASDNAHILYAATEKGLYASSDGGRHWLRVDTGIEAEEVFAVAISPGDSNEILIGTRRGALKSNDGGKSFERLDNGLPEGIVPLFISFCSGDKNWIYIGTARHGVYRSDNGGERFDEVNRKLPGAVGASVYTPVANLVINPENCQVCYAATEANGIYKTENGGRTWKAKNEGIAWQVPIRTRPTLLALNPEDPLTLFALTAFPVNSSRVDSRLYKTEDGGETWQELERLAPDDHDHGASLTFTRGRANLLLLGTNKGVRAIKTDRSISYDNYQTLQLPPKEDSTKFDIQRAPEPDFDSGNIAVLHDDGTLVKIFDLDNRTIQFTPNNFGSYSATIGPASFDNTAGTALSLSDNGAAQVDLPFSFNFYGVSRNSVFVNANGNLTFTSGDSDRSPTVGEFIGGQPRIAPLWDDLNPAAGGSVSVSTAANRIVFTWSNVPEAGRNNSNTFQAVLFNNGAIRLSYSGVATKDGLVGLSNGDRDRLFFVNFSNDLPRNFSAFPIMEFFDGALDTAAVGRKFYQTHPDNFDFLVVFGASSFPNSLAGPGAFAFHEGVRNDILGIGETIFNRTRDFGSAGRLQSFLNMTRLSEYPDDPNQGFLLTNSTLDILGQETGHRWSSFVSFDDNGTNSDKLLGRDSAHWSFFVDTDASVMEGNKWRDNGNGTFNTIEATTRFSPLDQYLMGLRAASEVPDFLLIDNPTSSNIFSGGQPVNIAASSSRSLPPIALPELFSARVTGTRRNISINQIITVEGNRSPAVGSAPTVFKQAFILVVPQNEAASSADLAKLERIRSAWIPYFNAATGGRGTIDTTLGTGSAGAPTITSFNPTSGPAGSTVTINGTNFSSPVTVQFNGANAVVNSVTANQLVVVVPNNATTGPISVTTSAGTALSSVNFTVTPSPPTILSFDPASGAVGTTVVIDGRNFSPSTAGNTVRFNGIAAQVISATPIQLIVLVPSGATTGRITVANSAGTATSSSNFTVPPPTITSFNPTSGSPGTQVTITGNNFASTLNDNVVRFSGVTASIASGTTPTSTTIVVIVPSGALTGRITVATSGGTATSSANFTINNAPDIDSFNPAAAKVGDSVTIDGRNFAGVASANTVRFNGVTATVLSATTTRLVARVPTGATTGPITVTTSTGTGTSKTNFTVIPAPVITSFSPGSGPVNSIVTINGQGLNFKLDSTDPSPVVRFNGIQANIDSSSATQLRVRVPIDATTGRITVTTAGGTAVSSADFVVTAPAPTIISFDPASAPAGSIVTITGNNFSPSAAGNSVRFNGVTAAIVSASASTILAIVPDIATTGGITVTTIGGTATSAANFTVPAPSITSLTPDSAGPDTQVTITGVNFAATISGNTVRFNGITAIIRSASTTELIAVVPSNASTGPVTVTTSGGTASRNFIVPPPVIISIAPGSGAVGTEVLISGQNFSAIRSLNIVRFNGVAATVITSKRKKIRVLVPAGATTGRITVTTPAGTATSSVDFVVTP